MAFQDEIYKNINPDTSKEIIAEINSHNRAMHKISTSANRLPINFLRGNDINKYIMTFEDTCRGCERLLSSTVPVFYTCHTTCFLTV